MEENKGNTEDAIQFKEVDSLDGFSGFDNTEAQSVNEDFWNDEPSEPETNADSVIDNATAEEPGEGKEQKPKTSQELADDLFPGDVATDGQHDDSPEIEETNDEPSNDNPDEKGKIVDKKPKSTKVNNISMVQALKEKGVIDYELEDGEELTEERADELLEDGFEQGIENRIEEIFGELPEIVKQLNKYAINGGDINQFFSQIKQTNSVGITSDIDLDDESNQELVVRNMMKKEEIDDEEIDAQIEYYKDSGKLKIISEKKFEKWKKDDEEAKNNLFEQQQKKKKEAKEKVRKYKSNISSFVNENEEIGSVKLSRKDKKELPSYIADKNIKLQNGSFITQRDNDLYAVLNNEKASIQLAYLLKNRNEDGTFNFKNIENAAKTTVAKEVKNNIRRNNKQTPNSSSNPGSSQKKEIHEYF